MGQEIADQLRERFTVLELETFTEDDQEVKAFCVVPADKIPLGEMTILNQWTDLHANLIKEYYKENYQFCQDAIEHLMGKFGGELDTFYEEILSRIKL
jgi:hypothetical protein